MTNTSNNTASVGRELSIYLLATYNIAMSVVTIFYNLLVITAFLVDRRIRTPFNMFLLNLAAADTNLAVFGMFYHAVKNLVGKGSSYHLCTFSSIMDHVAFPATVYATFLVSVDRTWAVLWPALYRHSRSTGMTSAICAAVWLVIVALAITYVLTDRLPVVAGASCAPLGRRPIALSFVLEVVLHTFPVLAMLICYGVLVPGDLHEGLADSPEVALVRVLGELHQESGRTLDRALRAARQRRANNVYLLYVVLRDILAGNNRGGYLEAHQG